MADIVHIERHIGTENVQKDILQLCSQMRPEWKSEDIKIKSLHGGSFNRLYCCYLQSDVGKRKALLIRVLSEAGAALERGDSEVLAHQVAHLTGAGHPVYGLFDNGTICSFVPGNQVQWEQLWDEAGMARCVMQALAKLHHVDLEKAEFETTKGEKIKIKRESVLFSRMKHCVNNIGKYVHFPEKQKRYDQEVKTQEELRQEILRIEALIEKSNIPVVFCHNDVWISNFIHDSVEGKSYLIDLEYAGCNYEGFDVGSFMSTIEIEREIDGSGKPPLNLNEETKLEWIRFYLEHRYELQGRSPENVTDEMVQEYAITVRIMNIVSRFYWAVLLLVLSDNPHINKDCLNFALVKFRQYEKDREVLFKLLTDFTYPGFI